MSLWTTPICLKCSEAIRLSPKSQPNLNWLNSLKFTYLTSRTLSFIFLTSITETSNIYTTNWKILLIKNTTKMRKANLFTSFRVFVKICLTFWTRWFGSSGHAPETKCYSARNYSNRCLPYFRVSSNSSSHSNNSV